MKTDINKKRYYAVGDNMQKRTFAALLLVGLMIGMALVPIVLAADGPPANNPSEKNNTLWLRAYEVDDSLDHYYCNFNKKDSYATGDGWGKLAQPGGSIWDYALEPELGASQTIDFDVSKDAVAHLFVSSDEVRIQATVTVTITAGSTEIGSGSTTVTTTVPEEYVEATITFKPAVASIDGKMGNINVNVAFGGLAGTPVTTGNAYMSQSQSNIVFPIIGGAVKQSTLEISYTGSTVEAKPGGSAAFVVTASNPTNLSTVATLNANITEGWTIDPTSAPITVEANSNQTVTYTVTAPASAKVGDTATITITGGKSPLVVSVKAVSEPSNGGNGTPGFEAFGLIGAIGVAAVLFKRKK
jgi:hypothetical protein